MPDWAMALIFLGVIMGAYVTWEWLREIKGG